MSVSLKRRDAIATVHHQHVPSNLPPAIPVTVLPPVPPPVARALATKTCDWCKSTMPKEAIRCPKCQEWEKDVIKHRRNIKNMEMGLMFLPLATAFLCFAVWPKTRGGDIFSDSSYPWHEKVPENRPVDFGNSGIIGKMLSDITNRVDTGSFYWKFSLKNFLTSLAGWMVITSVVCFIYCLRSCLRSQNILKQKTGSCYNF